MSTPRMSTYLLAFCIGEFEFISDSTKGGVLARIFACPGNASRCSFALKCCIRALEFYNEFFGIPYPLPKMDMIAIPDFAAGAMENWGLVTYREVALLCDESTVSATQKQRICTVIAHELAHQWFGNLVTMEWWEDLWLNEGFANWMQTWLICNATQNLRQDSAGSFCVGLGSGLLLTSSSLTGTSGSPMLGQSSKELCSSMRCEVAIPYRLDARNPRRCAKLCTLEVCGKELDSTATQSRYQSGMLKKWRRFSMQFLIARSAWFECPWLSEKRT